MLIGIWRIRGQASGADSRSVIENRTGGGGLICGEFVARAAPDGYTLIVGGSGQIVVTLTHRKIDLQKDFTPIAMVLTRRSSWFSSGPLACLARS